MDRKNVVTRVSEEKGLDFRGAQDRRGKRLHTADRYRFALVNQGALLIATGVVIVGFVRSLRPRTACPTAFAMGRCTFGI
jgi:hypothetical protein